MQHSNLEEGSNCDDKVEDIDVRYPARPVDLGHEVGPRKGHHLQSLLQDVKVDKQLVGSTQGNLSRLAEFVAVEEEDEDVDHDDERREPLKVRVQHIHLQPLDALGLHIAHEFLPGVLNRSHGRLKRNLTCCEEGMAPGDVDGIDHDSLHGLEEHQVAHQLHDNERQRIRLNTMFAPHMIVVSGEHDLLDYRPPARPVERAEAREQRVRHRVKRVHGCVPHARLQEAFAAEKDSMALELATHSGVIAEMDAAAKGPESADAHGKENRREGREDQEYDRPHVQERIQ